MLPLCHSRICIPVLTNVILVPQRGVEQSHARHRHVPERRQTAVFSILVTERSQSGHALPSGNRSVKARLIPTTISVPARSSQCVRCRSDPYPVHHKPQRRNNICKNHSVALELSTMSRVVSRHDESDTLSIPGSLFPVLYPRWGAPMCPTTREGCCFAPVAASLGLVRDAELLIRAAHGKVYKPCVNQSDLH